MIVARAGEGEFTGAEAVRQLLDIVQAQPLPLFSSSASVTDGSALSIEELAASILGKWKSGRTDLLQAANLRQLLDTLTRIPPLAIQTAVSVRSVANTKFDLAPLLSMFADITRASLWLSSSKPNKAILGEFIKEAVQICVAGWMSLKTLSVKTPQFDQQPMVVSKLDPQARKQIQNVWRVSIPESQLPRGRWLSRLQREVHQTEGRR
jgi:hypothetical protein